MPRLRFCAVCGDPRDLIDQIKDHAGCLTTERVGWMLHPFPPIFWRRVSVQALAPLVAYVGPLPQRDAEVLKIHQRVTPTIAFVYVICDAAFDVLYVGKTINPTGRLSSHRHKKPWWPDDGNLSLLAVEGATRREAEAAALHIESLAIRDLHPRHNIAGVI